MTCPQHRHLPSPWQPSGCLDCHPRPLSEAMGSGSIGTTAQTHSTLSEALVTMREELRLSQQESRALQAQVESLKAEATGLKRGLSASKRDAKRLRDLLEQERTKTQVYIEALNAANAREAK